MCTDGLANVGLGGLDGECVGQYYILHACMYVITKQCLHCFGKT